MRESACQAATRLAPDKHDPSDVIVVRPNVLTRCAKSKDPAACRAEFEATAYQLEGDYFAMPGEAHASHKQRWQPKRPMVQIAGPGTLAERWINAVVGVATLGLVSLQCSGCTSRKATLDRLGWSGLAYLPLTLIWAFMELAPAPPRCWRWSIFG